MDIDIRLAGPDDALATCEVLRRSIQECCGQDHRNDPTVLAAWLGNKTPANVATWFASASNYAVVAERDGVLVGVALMTQAGKLSLCYVVPEALHAGIGTALLANMEAQARLWGIKVISLHSTATASAFYARHGYLHAGKEKSCYGVECDLLWKNLNADSVPVADARQRFCKCSAA